MKDIIVDEIVDMFFAQKSLYEKANGTYVDKREKLLESLKEVEYKFYDYEDCDKKHGDICHNRLCIHSVTVFKNNETIYFKCGREDKK